VAAFAPAPVAAVLHLPTQLGVRWIALVARLGARLPVGPLAPAACIALAAAAAAALAVLAWRARPAVRPGAASAPSRGRWVLAACGAVVVGALASALTPAPAPALVGVVLDGARVWSRGGQAVVVVQKADDGLLEALREAGVRQVAVLVATRPGAQLAHALEPVVRRYQPPLVLAPAGSGLAGARPPVGLEEHRAGGAALVFSAADDGIEVVEVPAPP
jgi:beta-lactamase superfamily II metal-dependent hydrolase